MPPGRPPRMRAAINLLPENPDSPSGAHWFWTRVIPEMARRLDPGEELHLLVSPKSRHLYQGYGPDVHYITYPWSNERRSARTLSAPANSVAFLTQGAYAYVAGGAPSAITAFATCSDNDSQRETLAVQTTPTLIRSLSFENGPLTPLSSPNVTLVERGLVLVSKRTPKNQSSTNVPRSPIRKRSRKFTACCCKPKTPPGCPSRARSIFCRSAADSRHSPMSSRASRPAI